MREIKFRAWDGKEMHCLSEPYLDGHLGVMRMDYMKMPDTNAITLMQFTGLLDKSGKEIWEGDILAHTSWIQNKAHGSPQDDFSDKTVIEGVPLRLNKNPFPVHLDFISNPYRIVEYVTEQFYQATGFFRPFVGSCSPKEFEVLGNIYEHPELLKEKS